MTQKEIIKLEGRDLDAAVSEVVFGKPCVGKLPARAPDGCWSVMPMSMKGEDDGIKVEPVHVDFCCCDMRTEEEKTEEVHLWCPTVGHFAACLSVIPFYSSEWGDAGSLLEWLHENRNHVNLHGDNGWRVECWDVIVRDDDSFDDRANPVDSGNASTPQVAICRAALLAKVKP